MTISRWKRKDMPVPWLIYDHTYTLSATTPTLINFNYLGVTGSSSSPWTGTQFVMDNVSLILYLPPSPPVITTQPVGQIATGRQGRHL